TGERPIVRGYWRPPPGCQPWRRLLEPPTVQAGHPGGSLLRRRDGLGGSDIGMNQDLLVQRDLLADAQLAGGVDDQDADEGRLALDGGVNLRPRYDVAHGRHAKRRL